MEPAANFSRDWYEAPNPTDSGSWWRFVVGIFVLLAIPACSFAVILALLEQFLGR